MCFLYKERRALAIQMANYQVLLEKNVLKTTPFIMSSPQAKSLGQELPFSDITFLDETHHTDFLQENENF